MTILELYNVDNRNLVRLQVDKFIKNIYFIRNCEAIYYFFVVKMPIVNFKKKFIQTHLSAKIIFCPYKQQFKLTKIKNVEAV